MQILKYEKRKLTECMKKWTTLRISIRVSQSQDEPCCRLVDDVPLEYSRGKKSDVSWIVTFQRAYKLRTRKRRGDYSFQNGLYYSGRNFFFKWISLRTRGIWLERVAKELSDSSRRFLAIHSPFSVLRRCWGKSRKCTRTD